MPNPGQVVMNGAQARTMAEALRDAVAGTEDEEVLITMSYHQSIIVATDLATVTIDTDGESEDN